MLTTGPARIDQPRMIFRPPGQRLALIRVTVSGHAQHSSIVGPHYDPDSSVGPAGPPLMYALI